jgi:hypothetical protein
MKALNRKTSTTSLSINDSSPSTKYKSNNNYQDSRGSMPPQSYDPASNAKASAATKQSARAKSVQKEPLTREDSQKSNDSSSSLFGSSKFFTLTRKIGDKIRFRTSSQPPAPLKSQTDLTKTDSEQNVSLNSSNLSYASKSGVKSQSQFLLPQSQQQHKQNLADTDTDEMMHDESMEEHSSSKKMNLRDRALSPAKLFNSLRARSPFSRSRGNRASSATPSLVINNNTPVVSVQTTNTITNKNKGFTISLNNNEILESQNSSATVPSLLKNSIDREDISTPSMTANKILNRFLKSTSSTASYTNPSANNSASQNNQSRSISLEFIDQKKLQQNNNNNSPLRQVNETADEFDESSNLDNNSIMTNNSAYSATMHNNPNTPTPLNTSTPIPGVAASKFGNKLVGSKVEMLRKTFMDSSSTDVVKSVKFKDQEVSDVSNLELLKSDSSLDTTKSSAKSTSLTSTSTSQGATSSSAAASNNKPTKLSAVVKAKTIDFPDLLQNTIESNNGNLKPTNKQIQSILRRSETPPKLGNSLSLKQQHSIDSNDSSSNSNIEKLLKSSTSTSRPLMFNSNNNPNS